jgi:hypothetical protein
MGVVYCAYDPRLKRRVAVKLVAPKLSAEARFRERFLAETEVAASLEHPNVVPIHDAGEVDGRLYLVMRYVEGSDLKALLQKERALEPARALAICAQVASALDAAHERGLVHRDVKPSNVLLDSREHVYLADFGLTRRLADREKLAAAPRSLGTIDYVSPEQIRGEEVDDRADVYSLGCLLYECLMGEPPFRRSTDAAALFAHLEEEPPVLPGLESVIPKALAKHPEDRYGSCAELMEGAREALGIAEPSRNRWPLALAVLGLVFVGAALLAFLLRGSSGTPPSTLTGRLLRIDPATDRVAATAPVGPEPSAVAVGAGRVWVTTSADDGLWRIDPGTLRVLRIAANVNPVGVAINGGTAFVANDISPGPPPVGSVTLIDATSGDTLAVVPTAGASAIANGAGVWLINAAKWPWAGEVLRVAEPAAHAGLIVQSIPIPGPSPDEENSGEPTGVAIGEGGIWVLGDALERTLWRIDPGAGRIEATIPLPFVPRSVVAGAGAVWVTAQLDDIVARIDPARKRIVARIRVGREPTGVAIGDGSVWVADTIDRTVTRIDPGSNRVVATIPVATSLATIAVGEGSVWVAGDAR